MSTIELSELVRRLTRRSTRALEKGLDRCMKRKHYEVRSEHLLLGLLDDEGSDLMLLVRHYQLDLGRLRFVVERSLDDLRSGNAGNPTFAGPLRTWLEDASIEGAQKFSYPKIRSATLFLLLVRDPSATSPSPSAACSCRSPRSISRAAWSAWPRAPTRRSRRPP
jgi:type VI secretion system protein VasG